MKIITFRTLDNDIIRPTQPLSSLDLWYDKMRDIPIDKFSVGDIARCCRQNLYLDESIPIAITFLAIDINSGDLYDGELLNSIFDISKDYWIKNKKLYTEIKNTLISNYKNIDTDIKEKADLFMNYL